MNLTASATTELYKGRYPALTPLTEDPTDFFHHCRGHWETASQLAFIKMGVFERFNQGPFDIGTFAQRLELQPRPAMVFAATLIAGGFLQGNVISHLELSQKAKMFFDPALDTFMAEYPLLGEKNPNLVEFIDLIRRNAHREDGGSAFIAGAKVKHSQMLDPAKATFLTNALMGRARAVAPAVADVLPRRNPRILWDVGCGSGIYAAALLQKHENLTAVCIDTEPVLDVARRKLEYYGVLDRVTLFSEDMFSAKPGGERPDIVLFSNVLHDWDIPECEELLIHYADKLAQDGEIVIHDVLLANPFTQKPNPAVAYYGVDLYAYTLGRAYYHHEFLKCLQAAGLTQVAIPIQTAVDGWLIRGQKNPLS